jgi:CRISPR-associated protein Cmr2
MKTEHTNDLYWRKKLSAFMHDNPSKPLDVVGHEYRALMMRCVDTLQSTEFYEKEADFSAAAADRLPFPHAGKMVAPFDGRQNPFRHPFAPGCNYETHKVLTADRVDEVTQDNRTYLEQSNPQTDFIARWRFWRKWAQERMPELAFFPADTRIPDHTIWNHLGLTSAFQGCFERDPEQKAGLLLFTIGPVQPLIAAARRIGDLWSGSYLLSYLTSTVIGEIAREYGPDHILFPSAWGQPLVDLQLREIYTQGKVREGDDRNLWDHLWDENSDSIRKSFLLPSLPNRMLALLPLDEVESVARKLEEKVHEKLLEIGEITGGWIQQKLEQEKGIPFRKDRINRQLKGTLDVHWKTMPLPRSIEEAISWAGRFLPKEEDSGEHSSVATLRRLQKAWESLPKGHHTSYGMSHYGATWPVAFALSSWALDAVKSTRVFDAWDDSSSWKYGKEQNKDGLTGKEEVVLTVPVDVQEAKSLSCRLAENNPNVLRSGERLGAVTLIKRFWHIAYLKERYGFKIKDFSMPDIHQMVADASAQDTDESASSDIQDKETGYFAVLALDGDEMGKWVSGSKMPPIREQLANNAREYYEEVFRETKNLSIQEFLDHPRPLNPSFHLQFSEALANFGIYTARKIVESYNGRLIYAGGDDVLAILPVSDAIECAESLRASFRGENSALRELKDKNGRPLFQETSRGFVRVKEGNDSGRRPSEEVWHDVIVPGPSADVSVGIAIGHIKHPLQDMVREAQAAERRAKSEYGRGAVAISIFKRSGERVMWGAKWEKGLSLLKALCEANLESRFPYKLMALLEPYLGGDPDILDKQRSLDADFALSMQQIVEIEYSHCLSRSGVGKSSTHLSQALDTYWKALDSIPNRKDNALQKLRDFYHLMQIVAWFNKARDKKGN